jgi:hypothetical protein
MDSFFGETEVNRVPLTFHDRFEAFAWSIAASVLIFAIAKCYHLIVARRDKRKLIHGQPICWWMAISYLICAAFEICISDDRRFLYNSVAGVGAIGMLFGWFIGLIHGGMRFDKAFPLTRTDNVPCNKPPNKCPTR